jgi:RimJ/RimL family protein N-acetyltransferase
MAAGAGSVVVARTERLVLRRFVAADLDALIALHGDSDVMRYLARPASADEVRDEVLPRYVAEYGPLGGMGHWAGDERTSGDFVGWFALRPADDDRRILELGYRLLPNAWGRGLATEGAQAVLRLGFERYGAERILARTMTVNARSRSVMDRLGMRFVRTFHAQWPDQIEGADQGDVEYAIERDEWLS